MGLEIGFLRNKSIAHYEDTPCYQRQSTIQTIVLRENLIVASLVMKFSIFMELERALTSLQQPATDP